MSDKLAIYNMALGHLLEGSIASLSESTEKRRVLDTFWNNAVGICLEKTFWKFAKRTVSIDASSTTEPAFGFTQAFKIPADWVRTDEMSAYEQLSPPLIDVRQEAGYWYANVTPLFISYVSKDPLYGFNIGAWPETFVDFVALEHACKACKRITGSAALLQGPDGLLRQRQKAMREAMGNDAQNDPIKFPPQGSWVSSRRGFRVGRSAATSGDDPGSNGL
ncbi:hypothetical protein [Bradyrhizobium sp. 188]|uniref:hypothetical protein n=1 Tax=Bradyrhizobium sp. 188 TaxID=2782656 RepID=UPI001FFBCFD5|nr:hypothetical protein [Bradyrhizobium sp. 188]MCK1501500.1 hypothetical protein [Bradyrhizobium sp. 188]